MMKKIDPRVLKTRALLLNAIRDLTIEIGMSNLTILNVTKRAGVNRSTFYLHFQNKEEAIQAMTNELLEAFKEALMEGDYIDIHQAYEDYYHAHKPYAEAIKLFRHIQQFNDLYSILLNDQSFQKRITNVILTHLSQSNKKESELSFVTYGIIGLIQYWLNNGMQESVEEISLELTRVTIDFSVKNEISG